MCGSAREGTFDVVKQDLHLYKLLAITGALCLITAKKRRSMLNGKSRVLISHHIYKGIYCMPKTGRQLLCHVKIPVVYSVFSPFIL